jgi:hypothetical protein
VLFLLDICGLHTYPKIRWKPYVLVTLHACGTLAVGQLSDSFIIHVHGASLHARSCAVVFKDFRSVMCYVAVNFHVRLHSSKNQTTHVIEKDTLMMSVSETAVCRPDRPSMCYWDTHILSGGVVANGETVEAIAKSPPRHWKSLPTSRLKYTSGPWSHQSGTVTTGTGTAAARADRLTKRRRTMQLATSHVEGIPRVPPRLASLRCTRTSEKISAFCRCNRPSITSRRR